MATTRHFEKDDVNVVGPFSSPPWTRTASGGSVTYKHEGASPETFNVTTYEGGIAHVQKHEDVVVGTEVTKNADGSYHIKEVKA